MMLPKRINIFFVLFFFLFFMGCVPSPSISPVTYPKKGKGTTTYPDRSKYAGEFKDGKKDGRGTLAWPDGKTYVGEFKDDRANGQGTFTWPDGTTYVGEFKDGKRTGQGTFTWPNGMKYVGEFKDGKMDGQGALAWPNGMKYVGEFKNHKKEGQGTLTWPDGTTYVGEFKDGKSSIPGKYSFPNGNSYKGKVLFSPYVVDLVKESQAERIGLQVGDIAVEYNDIPLITGSKSLVTLVLASNPRDKIKLKVLRDNAERSFPINGGPIGILIADYPIIPENVKNSIAVASNYGQQIPGKNKMNVMGQRWAVIIGISNYKDTRIPPLRYASVDAKSFYDWAISPNGGKYPPSQVKLLLDNEATGRKIKDALYTWLKQALEEDVVAIYFAGHGSPESPDSPDNLYLLPYDTDYQNIASTGFPMWDIKTALKRFIKAKKVVVIADACHAGGVGQSFDVARRANRGIDVNPISSGFQNLSQIGDGVCVISASDDKQFSQESKDWGGGHGVFTYFLLEGLKGEADYNKDSNVTLGELIPYLSEQVRRATTNAQAPTVAGKFDPALSIGR